jgi:predicted NBD/HSP70 family sugar kinase
MPIKMKTNPNAACRLAVDIGGTFTDAVLETGRARITRRS